MMWPPCRARSRSTTPRSATAPRARAWPSPWRTRCVSRTASTSSACTTSRAAGPGRIPRTCASSSACRTRSSRARRSAPSALGTTLEENVAMISDSVAYLLKHFEEVIYDAEHFFDGFKRNPEYAMRTLRAAEAAGAHCLVLCDTNGGSLPHEVATIIKQVQRAVKAETPLGIHVHNDSECAVATSLAAVSEGIGHVQGTINGYGERCGNANLVSIIPNLMLKMGLEC